MSASIRIGEASIPLDSYVISGTALLGTKGAGKTYAGKGIAEQLLDHEIPIVVFDPIGRWRFMKIAGEDSKRPRGYKIVVAGGEQPDLPLTAQSAQAIVRAAIRENIPLVLDLYDRKLSKADWRRIVQTCFRTLLYENKGLRHIFLEETAEFAPQKVQDGETYAEVEKLVRMGGNASLGITLINQRAQEVNKAVLDLCDNLVLMKQRGSHAIDALEKWIDKLDPDSAKLIARAMPTMKAGEAWVFTGSAEAATHTHTAAIRSFHPDRSKPQLSAAAAAARSADPAEFVAKLSGELEQLLKEADANDPKKLQARIKELERCQAKAPASDSRTVGEWNALEEAAEERGRQAGYREGLAEGARVNGVVQHAWERGLNAINDAVRNTVQGMGAALQEKPNARSSSTPVKTPVSTGVKYAPQHNKGIVRPLKSHSYSGNGAGEKLPKAERALLTALAQFPHGCSRSKLALTSRYSVNSSTFDNALSGLRTRGYITRGVPIQATSEGISALGDFEPLPTGEALREHWLQKLGKAERTLLRCIIENYPEPISREDLGHRSNYSTDSSTFDNALSTLRTLELITRGELRASEDLF